MDEVCRLYVSMLLFFFFFWKKKKNRMIYQISPKSGKTVSMAAALTPMGYQEKEIVELIIGVYTNTNQMFQNKAVCVERSWYHFVFFFFPKKKKKKEEKKPRVSVCCVQLSINGRSSWTNSLIIFFFFVCFFFFLGQNRGGTNHDSALIVYCVFFLKVTKHERLRIIL